MIYIPPSKHQSAVACGARFIIVIGIGMVGIGCIIGFLWLLQAIHDVGLS